MVPFGMIDRQSFFLNCLLEADSYRLKLELLGIDWLSIFFLELLP